MEAIQKTNGATLAHVQTCTPEQKELIKRTVAHGASDDELALFLHVAQTSGLDPLRKQIHFIKAGGRIVFVADINGLQARAAREGDFEGILHAVVYEKDDFQIDNVTGAVMKHASNPFAQNGRLVGAWAIVKRRGMLPFVSVVKFAEYDNPNNALWKSKPAVMIDKCAKSTALRLAYPEQLGSVYEEAEIDKEEREVSGEVVTERKTANESIKEKLLAKTVREAEPKAPLIIDVPAGKTEEQAIAEAKAKKPAIAPSTNPAWATMVALGKQYGKTGDDLKRFVKGVTNKTKPSDITQDDVGHVHDALVVLSKPPPQTQPPESTDESTPF